MATFVNGSQMGTWSGYPRYVYLTGDTSRSGTTISVTNIQYHFVAQYAAAYGYNETLYIQDDGGNVSFSTTNTRWNFSGGTSPTIGLNSFTFQAASEVTWATLRLASSDGSWVNFVVNFPSGGTGPSGGSVTYNSCTWNSVNITSKVSSWGSGYSGTPNLEQIVVNSSATASDWTTFGRIVKQNATFSTSSTQSVSNANAGLVLDGGITIKGCTSFKVAMWASTTAGYTSAFSNTVHYTPPAPPSATVVDDGYTYTQRKTKLTLTGGNSTNNNSATVTFYYRYKKASESAYGAWMSMGTGTVTGSKTVTINLEGNTAYNIQFKQQYQGQDSEIILKNYTTPAVPIQVALYGSVNNQTKRVTKLYGSVNGQTKKVTKLYGSVNGQTKLIYTG